MSKPLITLCLQSNQNERWDHPENWIDSFFSNVIPSPGTLIKTKKGWFQVRNTPFIYNFTNVQEDLEEDRGGELIYINVFKV